MLLGSNPVSLDVVNAAGCGADKVCAVTPDFMAMNMHMLDLMYTPTGWLTLMLMPQWHAGHASNITCRQFRPGIRAQ
jgi:hypothetical protein